MIGRGYKVGRKCVLRKRHTDQAGISHDPGNLHLPSARAKEELNGIKLKKPSYGYLTSGNTDWGLNEKVSSWVSGLSIVDIREKVP